MKPMATTADALRDIRSSNGPLIIEAAKTLSKDCSTTQMLVKLLDEEVRPENRQGILYALAWHGDVTIWDRMVRTFSDIREDPRVRGQAMEAIAYMFLEEEPGSQAFEAASAALVVATRDPSPEVRYCAANTIGASGHLPLVPVLEALLTDHTEVPGWVGTVANEAARSLEWIVGMSKQRKRK